MTNESLTAFFQRIRANDDERQFVFRDLALRSYLVRAFDTTEEGLLVSNDGGGEWFDADSVTPPENPLRAIVIRQSDGTATDSPYPLLLKIMAHMRKCANGLCSPDWDGLLRHAYITPEYEKEWEEAAAEIDSDPFRLPADDSEVEEWLANACPMAIASQISKEIGSDISRDRISEYLANSSFINWNYWVAKMPILTAAQAARLMAGLDPDVFESLDSRPNKFNPAPLCSRAKSMERSAVVQQIASQSPSQWLEWADAHPFLVHDAFRAAALAIDANPLPEETAGANNGKTNEAASGVDRNRIIAAFPPPKGVTPEQWSKRLGDPSKKMKAARVFSGSKGGVSALWNPAQFAMWYADENHSTRQNLTIIIRREFPDYLPEWETYTASFN